VETYSKAFRNIGGDYFDVIDLPNNRTLFAVADVSGKGMPAALLAANIQALVKMHWYRKSTTVFLRPFLSPTLTEH
jgi:serine phosphatase RsbU (regulator of sigma subunit)